jgi:chemotaxis protein methyltransferase CheR
VSASVFNALRRLAYDEAGILLRENKQSLVSARIARRMRECGLKTEREYLEHLRGDGSGQELVHFLDAISTNFTSFFREPEHFDVLRAEVKRWVEQDRRELRLWCAAAATGEEPYSLAMTLSEALAGEPVAFRLLASDISVRALRTAAAGVYPESRFAQVPEALRRKYWRVSGTAGGEPAWRAADELRSRILFKRVNLATPPFPLRGELDAVFCRNVMIYFDTSVRQRLVSEMERLLRPGGLLVVAHSETLNGIRSGLKAVLPSVYRKSAAT